MRFAHGAVHWPMVWRRHGRKYLFLGSFSFMSRWQVRNLKTRCSSAIASRRAPTLVNGPRILAPLNSVSAGFRVMNTPGKSSRLVITRYGKVLSSVRRELNRGRISLMRRFSVRRASHSVSHSMMSKSVMSESMGCFFGPRSVDGRKYDATRSGRFAALPM